MASGPTQRVATHGLSSLLIRRVMRHSNVATLFHSSPSELLRSEPAEPGPAAMVVTAIPVAFPEPVASPVVAPSDVLAEELGFTPAAPRIPYSLAEGSPAAPLRPAPTVEGTPVVPFTATQSEISPLEPATVEARPAFPITEMVPTPAAPSLPRSSGGTPGIPAAGQGAPAIQRTATSPEIRRLPLSTPEARPAARFRPAPTAVALPTTSPPALPPSSSVEEPPGPSSGEMQPAIPSAEASSDTTLTDDVWRRLRTIFQRHQARDAAPDAETPQESEVTPRSDTGEAPTETPLSAVPPLASFEEAPEQGAPFREPGIVAAPSTTATATGDTIDRLGEPRPQSTRREDLAWLTATEAGPPTAAEPTEDGETPPLPLQSVWNVQQVPRTGETEPQAPEAATRTIAEYSHEPVRQVLDRVAPGGATQSTIEMLPPRRPRPRIPTAEAVPTAVRSPADAVASLSQRVDEPSLVQTAIGLLPADLWELIGEPLPEPFGSDRLQRSSASVPDRSADEADRADPSTPVSRAVTLSASGVPTAGKSSAEPRAAHAQPLITTAQSQDTPRVPDFPAAVSPLTSIPTAVAVPTAVGPHLVQRTFAPSASATAPVSAPPAESAQASPASEPSSGDTPASGGGADVDVADLARRVYAEIKRRLSVERERSRSPWH